MIVKFGYGETLDPDANGEVSLGDILRTTVILHAYPRSAYHVTWLVDPKGAPLLEGNRHIDRLLSAERCIPSVLLNEEFETVINLEKEPALCAVIDQITTEKNYGFRFDKSLGQTNHHAHGDEAMAMCNDPAFKRGQSRSWSEILFSMIDQPYAGQSYIHGYQLSGRARFDVGLNYLVGPKFPLKRWPEAHWQELHDLLSSGHSVFWQQGSNDLQEYIQWIGACRVLVTNDSLGLHIALALNKPSVALFGPTRASEVESTARLIKLVPEGVSPCPPCIGESCELGGTACIARITPSHVYQALGGLLNESQ